MKATLTLLLAAALMTMFVVSANQETIKIQADIKEYIKLEEMDDQTPEGKYFGIAKKPTASKFEVQPIEEINYYPFGYGAASAKANEAAANVPFEAETYVPFEQEEDFPFEAEKNKKGYLPQPEPDITAVKAQSEVKQATRQPGENIPEFVQAEKPIVK